jgi:anti-anti-sigma factor
MAKTHAPYPFAGEIEHREGVYFLTLRGDLGNAYRDELQNLLQQVTDRPGCKVLVLDITGVSYLASFAVAAIGYYYKAVDERGGVLGLIANGEQLLKPFRLAGLAEVIPTFSDRETAAKSLLKRIRSEEK